MGATDLDEMYQRLLFRPPIRSNTWDTFGAWCVFHRFHEHDPDGAVTTAALLVTDPRWRSGAGRLMSQIADAGLVPDEELELLAETFVAAGPQVYWPVPPEWFTGPEIVIDLGADGGPGGDDEPVDRAVAEDDDRPVVVGRQVLAPLRRWAAARLLGSAPGRWSALVARAKEMDSKSGSAIMRGLIDAGEVLSPEVRRVLASLATAWPNKGVREAASHLLSSDEDRHLRSPDSAAMSNERGGRRRGVAGLQPSLF